jgi:hypothetical protein
VGGPGRAPWRRGRWPSSPSQGLATDQRPLDLDDPRLECAEVRVEVGHALFEFAAHAGAGVGGGAHGVEGVFARVERVVERLLVVAVGDRGVGAGHRGLGGAERLGRIARRAGRASGFERAFGLVQFFLGRHAPTRREESSETGGEQQTPSGRHGGRKYTPVVEPTAANAGAGPVVQGQRNAMADSGGERRLRQLAPRSPA